MDWRQPSDDFGRRLAVSREAVLANTSHPWQAVEPFEAILQELRPVSPAREEKLERVRSLGGSCSSRSSQGATPWQWRFAITAGICNTSEIRPGRLLQPDRYAHGHPHSLPRYEGHQASLCAICAEFREDLPYQGSPGGRKHFHEWLKRQQSGDDVDPVPKIGPNVCP